MKPLGTITQYFPLVQAYIRQSLECILEQSRDYRDFTAKLCTHVCTNDSDEMLVFFSAYHANNLHMFEQLQQISREYGALKIIQPILYEAESMLGNRVQWNKVRDSADNILRLGPSEWISIEMLLAKLRADIFDFRNREETQNTIDQLKDLLKRRPDLGFLRTRFFDTLSHLSQVEGDHVRALKWNRRALHSVKSCRDRHELSQILRQRAHLIQRRNWEEAHELLLSSQRILEELGDPIGASNALHELSIIDAIRGEYDRAITRSLQVVQTREKFAMPMGGLAINLSIIYNAAEYFDAALAWSEMAEEECPPDSTDWVRARFSQVWALVGKGEGERAVELLYSARERALKSGVEALLADLYLVTGLLEFHDQDYATAMVSFEDAYHINRRLERAVVDLVCVYYLARTEVFSYQGDGYLDPPERIGPWLSQLLETGLNDNLPGIHARGSLLRARLSLMQGRTEDAVSYLKEVLSKYINENMLYLKQEICTLSKEFASFP